MEKALKIGKTSATGSFQLLLGVSSSTLIMAIGTIILTRVLSPAEYGLYTITMIPTTLINLLRDWGVNSAMTRYIASLRAENKEEEIRKVIVTGSIFEVVTGLALSFISLLLASFFASAVLGRPESLTGISIMSITIFSGSLLAVAQSSFIGFERMKLNSLTVVCQAMAKTVIGPILVIVGYGVVGAVVGHTLSFLVSGIIGLVILYAVLFRPLRKSGISRLEISRTLKAMLSYGVPLSIASILMGVLGQFYAFMMAIYATDTVVGNYHAAFNFSLLLSFFTVPISTVLFPAFAKLDSMKDPQLVRTLFASSVKYTSILLVPATMAVMALARPMVNTVFGENYVYAPFFLALIVIFNLFSVIGNLTLPSFLSGLGNTKVSMWQSLLALASGVPLAFLLVPRYGIVGVIFGKLFLEWPGILWGLYWVWRRYGVNADFASSVRIIAASGLAAIATYFSVNLITSAEWVKLVIGVSVFSSLYLLTAPLIKAIVQTDIENLRTMTSGLGIVSRLINVPLTLAEKVSNKVYA